MVIRFAEVEPVQCAAAIFAKPAIRIPHGANCALFARFGAMRGMCGVNPGFHAKSQRAIRRFIRATNLNLMPMGLRQCRTCRMAMARDQVIVDHADSLHERVDDGWAAELETSTGKFL